MAGGSNVEIIEELAASEGGIFTSGQALRAGIPRYALSYAARVGRIERLRHGAYRLATAIGSDLDDLRAVYKLTAPSTFTYERLAEEFDGIAVCGASAAYVLGVGDLQPVPWELATPKRFNSRMRGVNFRVKTVAARDVIWLDGLLVTRVERTISDLILEDEEDSLIADAVVGVMRCYGATDFDMRRLRELIGDERVEQLLATVGVFAGGSRELVEIDSLGHVALKEKG